MKPLSKVTKDIPRTKFIHIHHVIVVNFISYVLPEMKNEDFVEVAKRFTEFKDMTKGNLVNGLMRTYNIKMPGMSKMNTEEAYVAFGKKLVSEEAVKLYAIPIESPLDIMIFKRKSIKVAKDAKSKNK